MLRAPNFGPERMSVVLQQANNPTPMNDEMKPMEPHSFPGREFQLWFTDAKYDQCCDQGMLTCWVRISLALCRDSRDVH